MHRVKLCCDLAAPHGVSRLRVGAGLGTQALVVLSVMLAFALSSAQVEPRSVAERTGEDALLTVSEEQNAGPSGSPAPDGSADPTPTHGLTQAIDLDLRTDPRKDLQIQGPVEWEPGKLTLGPAASIRRETDVGDEAKLTLR